MCCRIARTLRGAGRDGGIEPGDLFGAEHDLCGSRIGFEMIDALRARNGDHMLELR